MLVEHHVKYKEIHGIDETVWMDFGEHAALHRRLRKEGKCNIPVLILKDISNAANRRALKTKIQTIEFEDPILHNFRLIERIKYNIHTGGISYTSWFRRCSITHYNKNKERSDKHIKRIDFREKVCKNVRFNETLRYNPHTGNIYYVAYFESYHGHILLETII